MSKKILAVIIILGAVATAAVFLFNEVGSNTREVASSLPIIGDESTSAPTPTVSAKFVLHDVPFTPQAPFAEWDDQRQQDGCEEASALMAIRWAQGRSLTLHEARAEIINASDFELEKYGEYRDVSTKDTIDRIIVDYFGYDEDKIKWKKNVDIEDIKRELLRGNIVILHVDGRLLGNPYFSGDGPEYHSLVVKGFDDARGEFITNDPGTKRGESYRYKYSVLENSIRDYPTGFHLPRLQINKNMIVVSK